MNQLLPDSESPESTCLSPKQLNVLAHLLAGESINEAAAAAGVHRTTIYLWRHQQAFRRLYDTSRLHRALAIADQATSFSNTALHSIHAILCNPETSPAVRLRAATLILKTALQPLTHPEIRQNSTKSDTEHVFVEPVEPITCPEDPTPLPSTGTTQPQPIDEQPIPEIREAIPPAARLSAKDLLKDLAAKVEARTGFRLTT